MFHSGVSQTLCKLRYRLWIPHGRSIVRTVLNRCRICRRAEGGPYKMPPMAPLPSKRVTESTQFLRTGMDYLGPLYVKDFDEPKKVWVWLWLHVQFI